MIRLIHTADWHLGATLQGWSREPEHRAALAQLIELAGARQVDAIIVAGDIFDSLNPSAEAQRLLYDTLRDLRAAVPHAAIVVIAGNHDPAGRLEAPRALFEIAGVACVGVVARQDGGFDARPHLTPIRDRDGKTGAFVLAMAFPRPADLPNVAADVEGSPVIFAVRELYREAIEAARREIGNAPLVVTGHLHVAGALESEGAERRILIGGEHAAPVDIFPEDVAYVALGHLHRPQRVGRDTIRYSGALIPMSKSEIDYAHGATLVEIDDAGRANCEPIAFTRAPPHLRLPSRGAFALAEVDAALAALALEELPLDRQPFAHLHVKVDGPATGLKAQVDAICAKYPIRVVSLTVERPQLDPAAQASPTRLVERQPVDLFREAFAATHRVAPSPDHLRCFERLAQEA